MAITVLLVLDRGLRYHSCSMNPSIAGEKRNAVHEAVCIYTLNFEFYEVNLQIQYYY